MNCPYCGSGVPENSRFCPKCGKDVTAGLPLTDSTPTTVLDSVRNPYALQPEADTQTPYIAVQNPGKKAKKKMPKALKKTLIILPIVLVLAALIGVGSFALVRLNSPMMKIGRAMDKLVMSGDAYSYDINAKYSYNGRGNPEEADLNFSGDLKIDTEAKTIELKNGKTNFFQEAYKDNDDINVEFGFAEGFISYEDKSFGFRTNGTRNGKNYETVFYNGIFMSYENGELISADGGEIPELERDLGFSVISIAFDLANGDKSEKEAYEEIKKLIEDYCAEKEIEIEFDMSDIEFEINKKVLRKVKRDLFLNFTDEKWLEENFGLSKESKKGETTYTFDIDPEKAIPAVYEIMKPLIVDTAEQLHDFIEDEFDEDIDEDYIDEMYDDMMNSVESLNEDGSKFSLKIEISLKDGEVSEIEVSVVEEWLSTDEYGSEYECSESSKVKVGIEKCGDFGSVDKAVYSKDLEKGKALAEIAQKNRTCYWNIERIESNADNFYYSYDRVPTNDELAQMFDDKKLPRCPWHDCEYEIAYDAYDDVYVRCTDKECENYQEPFDFPEEPSYEEPYNPYDDSDYGYYY